MLPHIANLIERHAIYRPDHNAIVFEGRRFSYADLNRRANRLGYALRRVRDRKCKMGGEAGLCRYFETRQINKWRGFEGLDQ